jgi:hydrogenase-1 operon protein HyaE
VMLRDGGYLGAVDGIRDWDAYVCELDRLLRAEPVRAPGIGVALVAAPVAPSCAGRAQGA